MRKSAPCFECGKSSIHDHHVIPRLRGGKRTVPLCRTCHNNAHDRDVAPAPYGFDYGDDGLSLVESPQEYPGLMLMLSLFSDGLGYAAIARQLTALGVKTKYNAKKWAGTTVRNILKRHVSIRPFC